MGQEIPQCRNFRENRECSRSDMRLVGEDDESWHFVCKCCELMQVVSKDGVRDKSKFDNAKQRMEQQADLVRRWEKRKKLFAVRG